MKFSYDDEFLSQIFTFFPDKNEDSFSVNVIGTPVDLVLFNLALRSNGLIFVEDLKHDS